MNRIFTILILLVGLHTGAFAQNRAVTDPAVKIVRFYPNPATTVVTFELSRSMEKGYSFQITNFMGRKLIEQKNIGQRYVLPLNNFYRGLYFYHLLDRNGRIVETGRFQVIK